MQFNRTTGINTGYWYLSRFVLSYWNTSLANTPADPMNNDVSIEYSTNFIEQTPFGYSYHCHKQPTLVVKNATGVDKDSAPMIDLDNFQVSASENFSSRNLVLYQILFYVEEKCTKQRS